MLATLQRLYKQKLEELDYAAQAQARLRTRDAVPPRAREDADIAVRLIEGECLALAKACDLMREVPQDA